MLQLYLFHSLNESFCTIIFNIEIKGLLFCDILSSGIVFDPLQLENATNICRRSLNSFYYSNMRLSLHKKFNPKDAFNCTAYFIQQMHFLRSRVIKNIPDAHSFDLHLNKNRFPNIQVKEEIRYLTFYTQNILNGQFDIKCKCVFYIIGLVALLHQYVNYCNTQEKEMHMIIILFRFCSIVLGESTY